MRCFTISLIVLLLFTAVGCIGGEGMIEPIKYGGSFRGTPWSKPGLVLNKESNKIVSPEFIFDATTKNATPIKGINGFIANIPGKSKAVIFGEVFDELAKGKSAKYAIVTFDLSAGKSEDIFYTNNSPGPIVYNTKNGYLYSYSPHVNKSDTVTVLEIDLNSKAIKRAIDVPLTAISYTQFPRIEVLPEEGWLFIKGDDPILIIDINTGKTIRTISTIRSGDFGLCPKKSWLIATWTQDGHDYVTVYNYKNGNRIKQFRFAGGYVSPEDVANHQPLAAIAVNSEDGRAAVSWGETVIDFEKETVTYMKGSKYGVPTYSAVDAMVWDERDNTIIGIFSGEIYKFSSKSDNKGVTKEVIEGDKKRFTKY